MNRKAFISFLGTNNYLETHYEIQGKLSEPVRFVQEALIDHFCTDWTEDDRIFIFYTAKSKAQNWDDNGNAPQGLGSILEGKNYRPVIEATLIDEGFSEEEIWKIFDNVYDKIMPEDEIYFDVTHAFRSIPLFSTVLFNYAQYMKGTVLKHVWYGAFEKLGPAYLVKNMPLEERKAPVLELSNMIQLQKLTALASNFTEFGRMGNMADAFASEGGDKALQQWISKLKCVTNQLEEYILTNRIQQIEKGEFVEPVVQHIQLLNKKKKLTTAQKEILDVLLNRVSKFRKDGGVDNIIAAVQWATEYDMIQQAYTLAEELIITLTAQKYQKDNTVFDQELSWRNFISGILAISDKDVNAGRFNKELSEDILFTQAMLEKDEIQKLRPSYSVLASNRNILSHGKKSTMTLQNFRDQLNQHFKTCLNILHVSESNEPSI